MTLSEPSAINSILEVSGMFFILICHMLRLFDNALFQFIYDDF